MNLLCPTRFGKNVIRGRQVAIAFFATRAANGGKGGRVKTRGVGAACSIYVANVIFRGDLFPAHYVVENSSANSVSHSDARRCSDGEEVCNNLAT